MFTLIYKGGKITLPYTTRFSAVEKGELLLRVAGGGYLEIAMNQGNASKKLGLTRGQRIKIEKKPK